MTVKEYCESNGDYKRLLDVFTQNYIDTYNKHRVAQRNKIKIYLSRNFGYWYHSNLDPLGDVSPANFINSDIAHKLDKQVTVYPVCKPVFKKDKLMDITYTFNVFSTDDHPFVKDMATLMNNLRDYVFPDGGGLDALSVETIMEMANDTEANYAFGETAYLSTLYGTCMGLKLMDLNDAEGSCGITVNEKACDTFFALRGKEKLKKIISVLINQFITKLEECNVLKKIPTVKTVEKMLKKGMEALDFYEEMFGDLPDIVSRFEMDESMNFYSEDMEELSSLENHDVKELMDSAFICSMSQRYFLLPFGHYLQLLQPLYIRLFGYSLDDKYLNISKKAGLNENTHQLMTFMNYMVLPDCYKLSPLGVGLLRDGKPERNPIFPDVRGYEYQEVLDEMLEVDEDEIDFDGIASSLIDEMFYEDEMNDIIIKTKKSSNNIMNFPAPGNKKSTAADKNAKYRFEVKRWRSKSKGKTITLKGTDTMAGLAGAIVSGFDLDMFHLYAFYMGSKFYDASTEIGPVGEVAPGSGAEELNLNKMEFCDNQKFLFLYDFGDEHRFQITFLGKE